MFLWRTREKYHIIVIKYSSLSPLKPDGFDSSVRCTFDWRSSGRRFDSRQIWQHAFMKINPEIFSSVILSLPLIQEGSCQFLMKDFAQGKVWSGKLTALDMTQMC